MKKTHGVGIAGLGTIGSGVAEILLKHEQRHSPLKLNGILEKYPESRSAKPLYEKFPEKFLDSLEALVTHPEIDVVVETIGGQTFAKEVISQALRNGKHVVTANKDLIATHGLELTLLARQCQRHLLFEASVGGAIPVLRLLDDYFSTSDFQGIYGIVNGTTNYILSEMDQKGLPFETALEQAQEKGFAEQDPTNDIKGFDARYKTVILNYLVTGDWLAIDQVMVEGIDHLTQLDFEYATRMGRTIKLIACLQWNAGKVRAFVLPLMVPEKHILAKVEGATNIISIQDVHAEEISILGQGAGSLPTGSAIVSDIYKTFRQSWTDSTNLFAQQNILSPFSEYTFKHTLRCETIDRPGIFGDIGMTLAKYGINIYAFEQLPRYHWVESPNEKRVIFTLTLEACQESRVIQALEEINQADYMTCPVSVLRELPALS